MSFLTGHAQLPSLSSGKARQLLLDHEKDGSNQSQGYVCVEYGAGVNRTISSRLSSHALDGGGPDIARATGFAIMPVEETPWLRALDLLEISRAAGNNDEATTAAFLAVTFRRKCRCTMHRFSSVELYPAQLHRQAEQVALAT